MNRNLIYKFLPFSINSLKLLIKGEFWFGLPENQNDPFEGKFTIKKYYSLPPKNLIEFFYEINIDLLNGLDFQQKIDEINLNCNVFHNDMYIVLKKRLKKHYGITCFSYKKDNILMWSHYSDSHKGFSIIFDKALLYDSIKYPKEWIDFNDVNYKPRLCEAELILDNKKIGFKNEKEILFHKLNIWRSEQETRLIAIFKGPSTPRNIKFSKESVKGIIFGENMLSDDKKTISEIISADSSYSNVRFYNACKDLEKLRMKINKE